MVKKTLQNSPKKYHCKKCDYYHIAMEQSYGYIDGDSATVAEYCSLMSAITRLPARQNLAITGSMNQLGEVQAIGGVNEKIEGFFKLCSLRGLTGEHGVIVPQDNVKHLMLQQSVIDAVAAGQFTIYAVKHVYEALHLLTDCEPGEADLKGDFPAESLNGKAQLALKTLYELYQETDEAHYLRGQQVLHYSSCSFAKSVLHLQVGAVQF